MRLTFIELLAPGLHVHSFMKSPRLGLPLLGTLVQERGNVALDLGVVDLAGR